MLSSRIVRSSDHLRSVSDARTRAAALIRSRKFEQLGVELLDRARGGRGVDELVLDLLELLGGELVIVELVEVADRVRGLWLCDRAAGEDLLLAALEAFGAALAASDRSPRGSTRAAAAGP